MRPLGIMAHTRPVTCVKYNSTGDLLFSSGVDGCVNVWNPADGRKLGTYARTLGGEPGGGVVRSLDLTHDDSRLVIGAADGLFVFEVETAEQLAEIPLEGACRSATWSTRPLDETLIVAARDQFTARVPKAILLYRRASKTDKGETYELVHEITDFESRVMGVAFGPFDETIVARHEDGTISLWDTETAELLKVVQGHENEITNWDFSGDRAIVVTVSRDQHAKMWALPDLELIQDYPTDRPLNGVALSPLFDSAEQPRRHMVVGGGQSADQVTTTKASCSLAETLLVHLETAQVMGQIAGHFSPTNHLAFCPDGRGFVTGAVEGNLNIWRFDKSYFNPKKFM